MQEKNLEEYIEENELNIDRVINDYSGYIYIVIKNMTKEVLKNEDIEEIISDVFVAFWNNKEKIDIKKPIKPYLSAIAKNMTKLKYRKIKFNYNIEDYENNLINTFSLEESCEINEKNNIIEKALKNMKEQDREIFLLYYYNSRKIKEISKVLDISEGKVKTRLHRIRKKLRQELEKGGYKNG